MIVCVQQLFILITLKTFIALIQVQCIQVELVSKTVNSNVQQSKKYYSNYKHLNLHNKDKEHT